MLISASPGRPGIPEWPDHLRASSLSSSRHRKTRGARPTL